MGGKNRVLAGLLVAALVLQMSLLPFLQLTHVRPDLLLVLAVLAGLVFGPREALALGLGAGLLQDLLAGRTVGLFTVGKLAAAALAGLVGRKVYMEHLLTPVVTALTATFIERAAMVAVLYLAGLGPGGWDRGRDLVVEAGLNAVVAGALFGLVARIGRRFKEGAHTWPTVRAPWL